MNHIKTEYLSRCRENMDSEIQNIQFDGVIFKQINSFKSVVVLWQETMKEKL